MIVKYSIPLINNKFRESKSLYEFGLGDGPISQ